MNLCMYMLNCMSLNIVNECMGVIEIKINNVQSYFQ